MCVRWLLSKRLSQVKGLRGEYPRGEGRVEEGGVKGARMRGP